MITPCAHQRHLSTEWMASTPIKVASRNGCLLNQRLPLITGIMWTFTTVSPWDKNSLRNWPYDISDM